MLESRVGQMRCNCFWIDLRKQLELQNFFGRLEKYKLKSEADPYHHSPTRKSLQTSSNIIRVFQALIASTVHASSISDQGGFSSRRHTGPSVTSLGFIKGDGRGRAKEDQCTE